MDRQCSSCGAVRERREDVKEKAYNTLMDSLQAANVRINHLEEVIKSHGIYVKTVTNGVPWYCMGEPK